MIGTIKRRYKAIIAATVAIVAAGVYFVYLVSGLPSLEQLENPRAELSTKVYSIDGEVLDNFFVKNRVQITLGELPSHIIDALLATEDKNFHSHWGVDLPRFARAMVKNVFTLQLREGASTITQQLARNLYDLKGARESLFGKVTRKLREFITAVQIERNYTKDEILEMYLSVAYFGRSAYGIATASQTYFSKNVWDLTKPEAAVLIGLLRGPAVYDPFNHPDRALMRRNTVLSQMVKYDYLPEQDYEKLKELPLGVNPALGDYTTGIAPHFVEWIRQTLIEKAEEYGFDIYRDGLSVYTTLDSRMQRMANRAVEAHLKEYQADFYKAWKWDSHPDILKQAVTQAIRTSDRYRAADKRLQDSLFRALSRDRAFVDSIRNVAARIEVGFVAIDHTNGNILAMVGGSNFRNFKYGLNHVTQIQRQPGSAFKPFVYTVAIDNGYPPSFEILNQPITLVMADGKRWAPNNFDGTFGGKSTLQGGAGPVDQPRGDPHDHGDRAGEAGHRVRPQDGDPLGAPPLRIAGDRDRRSPAAGDHLRLRHLRQRGGRRRTGRDPADRGQVRERDRGKPAEAPGGALEGDRVPHDLHAGGERQLRERDQGEELFRRTGRREDRHDAGIRGRVVHRLHAEHHRRVCGWGSTTRPSTSRTTTGRGGAPRRRSGGGSCTTCTPTSRSACRWSTS